MLEYLKAFASETDHPLGLLILFASSAIEYVFPPFPGDTVTLFGAILVTAYRWSFFWVMALTTLGSLLGAMIDYHLGAWTRRRAKGETPQGKVTADHLARISRGFERHGELYIVLNRFLPGIRAFFFYAAGYAGMRLGRVLFFAALSALAWNLILVGVGSALGANLDELAHLVAEYTLIVWGVLAAIALFFLVRMVWRRRAGARREGGRA